MMDTTQSLPVAMETIRSKIRIVPPKLIFRPIPIAKTIECSVLIPHGEYQRQTSMLEESKILPKK